MGAPRVPPDWSEGRGAEHLKTSLESHFTFPLTLLDYTLTITI